MRATHYEHGTTVATPKRTARGFVETSILHYKTAYADKSHGKDETLTNSDVTIDSLFLGLPSCFIGWIVLAVMRAITDACEYHFVSFLLLLGQYGCDIVAALLVIGIINITLQAFARRARRY